MKPVILWTDALIWLLVAVIVFTGLYMRRKPHLREPWQRVIRSRMGMSALVVLLAFVLIGLLDSLHFREALPDQAAGEEVHYSGEVLSLFDKLVGPLRTQVEKTYSAPFSAWLYMKEMIERPDGSQVRDYPRLEYGAAHLADPVNERGPDIARRLGLATLQTLAGMGLVLLITSALVARRYRQGLGPALGRSLRGGTALPLPTLLLTLGALLWLLFASINLAGAYHVFGTDKVGQDVFYQALKSVRTGLVIGTLTTLIMLPFAVLLGIMAGYFRGWVDDVIQYLYTTLNSIPGVLLIAAAVLMMQVYMDTHPELFETMAERADLRLLFLCIILGVTSWTGLCRMLRGETLKLRELDYIQAATAFGVPNFVVILRHILPNVMHIVLIAVVLDFSGLVLAEAVLSYVGVGVDPTMNSWGNMINRARLEMAREPMVWWSLLAAFIFMFTLVLAANLFSDVVRDAFDPRLREQRG
ncbi:peptide ABC transporter permease [Thiohalobacter sp. COW1]|uniref:ABC-type dipeptide/oligopeptide/nickel transporters, permease components n=1 Tax=Thiohalobacter thiocyanaticus TaxID=585455 RepID=A0A1Z4VR69_9GAMM|nr:MULTISPECIES: ABC transporter permease [Thiohalobacter]BAZ93983.1 ABC-type dipeptide/oligopeptide/nickel transporters, permease components [Thiohalobacter thiocyanaticus]BCO30948.1 peptide ABC transporter permease [Thiohalobacter sp. COW1]